MSLQNIKTFNIEPSTQNQELSIHDTQNRKSNQKIRTTLGQ
jgi:hypothetical protein